MQFAHFDPSVPMLDADLGDECAAIGGFIDHDGDVNLITALGDVFCLVNGELVDLECTLVEMLDDNLVRRAMLPGEIVRITF